MIIAGQRRFLPRRNVKCSADSICEDAKNTIFHDWMTFWAHQNSINSDMIVIVGSSIYRLHSCVMAFWSEYFHDLLHFQHESSFPIMIPNIEEMDFECVLMFIYQGRLDLSQKNFGSFLDISNKLKINALVKYCCNYLIKHMRDDYLLNLADIFQFLCLPTNSYSSRIILPQLIKRWDIIQSSRNYRDILRRISFEMLKTIITSSASSKLNDADFEKFCYEWIGVDIKRRFQFITNIVECIVGYSHPSWKKFNTQCIQPRNIKDVKSVFDEMLHCCIKKDKIEFQNYIGLVINKEHCEQIDNKMAVDKSLAMLTPTQFFFYQWYEHMRTLRWNNCSNITVNVHPHKAYCLEYWILCISSEYFRDLEPNSRNHVKLDLRDEDFTSVINYMYGKKLHITSSNIMNLIRASRYLKIHSCEELILKFIQSNFNPVAIDIIELFNVSCEESDNICTLVERLILKNFADVKKCSIINLKFNCLKTLITSNELKKDAKEKLNLCYDWIMHDIVNRFEKVYELSAVISENSARHLYLEFSEKMKKNYNFAMNATKQPDNVTHDVPNLGKPFVINIPLLDLPNKYKNRVKTPYGKPFTISLPRLDIGRN